MSRAARQRVRTLLPHPAVQAVDRTLAAWRGRRALGPRLGRYVPEPCLTVPRSFVVRADVPAVDIHTHLGRWLTRGAWAVPDVGQLLDALDVCGVDVVVNLDGRWGEELEANLDRYDRAHPDRFATFCHVDWRLLRERDGVPRLVASLERSAAAGARGLKVWKDLGLRHRGVDGALVLPGDERLAPLWAAAGDLGFPVLVHTGDPAAFFRPVDRRNERLEELRRHPDLSLHGRAVPSLDDLLDSFERMVGAHPGTTFVGAHVAGAAEDLRRVERMLASHPNLRVDLGARLADLGRQPRATRRLIEEHPDRILFGSDETPPTPGAYHRWFRFLETDDEAFPYSDADPPPSGRWPISGLGLPRPLLERVYRTNALEVLAPAGLTAGPAPQAGGGEPARPMASR